jgi:flagellar motor component MotA
MFSIVGILAVFGCVIAGFLMEKGKLPVLIQPAELVTIGGAALGTVLTANPMHVIKGMIGSVLGVLKGSPYSRKRYTETLKMMFDILSRARKDGAVAIEPDVEDPSKSAVFSKYPAFLKDHHVRDFVCDTLRMAVTGGVNPFDVDQVMQRMENITEVGRGIAVAFVATIYGVGAANIFFLPCAGRVRILTARRHLLREMVLDGVACIVDGLNPRAMEQKLVGYVTGPVARNPPSLVAR